MRRWPSCPLPRHRTPLSHNQRYVNAARARGRVGGRPTVVTPELLRAARDTLPNPEASITAIANLFGASPGTLDDHIPDLRELHASRALG